MGFRRRSCCTPGTWNADQMLSLTITFSSLLFSCLISSSEAFSVLPESFQRSSHHVTPSTVLHLKLNKQQDLKKKLELAKKQNKKEEDIVDDESKDQSGRLTDKEIKEQNDRLRFQEMLDKKGSIVLNDYGSGGYLNKQQEEEEINAARK